MEETPQIKRVQRMYSNMEKEHRSYEELNRGERRDRAEEEVAEDSGEASGRDIDP